MLKMLKMHRGENSGKSFKIDLQFLPFGKSYNVAESRVCISNNCLLSFS